MTSILAGIAILGGFCALLCFIGRPRPDASREEAERLMRQFLKMPYDERFILDLKEQDKDHRDEQARRSPSKLPKGWGPDH